LEQCLGRKAIKNFLPMQAGDVPNTWADAHLLAQDVGYRPSTELSVGVQRFVEWHQDYYGQNASLAS
jgi:UDP-glucuronate 4-epimerase